MGPALAAAAVGPGAGENTYHIMLELPVYVPASLTRWGAPSGQYLPRSGFPEASYPQHTVGLEYILN